MRLESDSVSSAIANSNCPSSAARLAPSRCQGTARVAGRVASARDAPGRSAARAVAALESRHAGRAVTVMQETLERRSDHVLDGEPERAPDGLAAEHIAPLRVQLPDPVLRGVD